MNRISIKRVSQFLWGLGIVLLLQLAGLSLTQAQQTGADFDHSSTGYVLNTQHQTARCESCHIKGVFKGTPKTCESCHGWNNPRAATVMPTSHIPTANQPCDSCHAANQARFQDAALTFNHANVRALNCLNCHSASNPHPGVKTNPTDTTHTAALAQGKSCDQCHTTIVFAGPKVPSNHIPTAAVACTTCHTSTDYRVMPTITDIHANAPAGGTNCAQCHSAANALAFNMPGMVPPLVGPGSRHIGMNGQNCDACHVGAGSSIAALPVVDGAHFSGSKFNHGGVSTGCASCHGPGISGSSFQGVSSIVVMPDTSTPGPTSHIPSSTSCETCHVGAMPSGQIAANASQTTVPGTQFRLRPPSANAIHSGASTNCAACHEAGNVWVGMDLYPITTSAPYKGFQTRPQTTAGTFNVADPSHPVAGDCSICHSVGAEFSAPLKPANHIPVAPTAACSACHKVPDFAVMPALVDIHTYAPSASSNCAQCHSPANAASYTTAKMRVVSTPSGHVPDLGNVGCEGCHVGAGSSIAATPVPNGASFANSAFSHNGIGSGCATCHGPTVKPNTFYGISQLVVMAQSRTPGANAHLPTTTVCENCHTVAPANLVPANAPSLAAGSTGFYTLFTPTASMIHAGSVGGCASCHDTNFVWMGMDKYPITTSAPYKGFQTRPQLAASGTYFVQDPAHPVTGECSNCHGSQIDFNVSVPPANHIPIGGTACTACHKNVDYTVMPSLTDIHAPATSAVCADCHSATNAAKYNAMASMRPAIVAPPAKHIAMGTLGCDACHVGPGSSMPALPVVDGARFSGSLFSHTGISGNCDTCHGASVTATTFAGVFPKTIGSLSPAHLPLPGVSTCETCHTNSIPTGLVPAPGMKTFAGAQYSHSGITSGCDTCHGPGIGNNSFYGVTQIVVMPPSSTPGANSHLPTSTACESCHLGSTPSSLVPGVATRTAPGSLFQTPVPTAAMIHSGVVGNCSSCHDSNFVWMGMSQYPITLAAPYKGFQTRPLSVASTFNVADAAHPLQGDCSNCHAGFSEFGVPSMPANHIPTVAACATCHKSTNFAVMPSVADIHANVAPTNCAQCHSEANAALYNSMPSMSPQIVAPPPDHIPQGTLGCEGCHVGTGSSIAALPVANGARFSGSLFNHQGSTAVCNTCHGSLVTAGTFTGVTPKSIASLTPSHVPVSNNLACDVCHVNSVPTGLVPAAGMKTFAGGQFSHTGISTGCDTCHGPNITSSSFFGISKIVVMPPSAAPGSGSHLPTSTACESCHLGSLPTTLVPASATQTAPGSQFKLPAPTAAMIHAGVTGACASCHETNYVWMGVDQYPITTAAPFKGFQTRPQTVAGTYFVKDTTHPGVGECSNCHVGFSAFTAPTLPAIHIPYAAGATCAACHGDFTALPTISKIHANAQSTSTNCAQCHSEANAATYSQNAQRAIVTIPSKHIGMAALGCEGCHVGSNSSLTLPIQDNAKFSKSAYSHVGVSSGCDSCHGANVTVGTFFGVTPKTIASLKPAHVPVVAAMGCDTCHTNSIPSMLIPASGATAGMTTFAGAQFSHSGITNGCATCHGPAVTGATFYGVSKIVVMPPSTTPGPNSHLPTTTTCENCHLGSMPTVLVPGVAVKSAPGSGFLAPNPTPSQIHAGTTGPCSTCHETNMVWMSMGQYPITTVAPYKGFQTRPQSTAGTFFVKDTAHPTTGECSNCHASMADFTANAMPANHIPIRTGAACTSCHTNVDLAVMPTIANIHANAPSSTTNCAQCHSASNAAIYNTMASMVPPIKTVPSNHIDMGALGCEACHVSSGGVTSSLSLPVQNSAKFSNSAYSHTGVTTGCADCHGSSVTVGTFFGVTPKTMVGLAPRHVPSSQVCENCHTAVPSVLIPLTGGTGVNTFANASFSHTGISTNCADCHGAGISGASFFGISRIVALSNYSTTSGTGSHIPAPNNASCETCHAGNTPAALVSANASVAAAAWSSGTGGATSFYTPAPTSAQIHSAVGSTTCVSCHEAGLTWIGLAKYPRTPATLTANATYTGFHGRPVAGGAINSIADGNHPNQASGDCSKCHGSTSSFSVASMPSNHIPIGASAACTACHTNITATNKDFSVKPAKLAIHQNGPSTTASDCGQCHSATNAAKYAIPSASFAIVAPASNHVPFGSTNCSVCHTAAASTVSYTSFANGLYSHAGVTSGCATCHASTVSAFQGIALTQLVVAANNSTQGANNHIPFTAACEVCHAGSTPTAAMAIPATKPAYGATGFRTPAPTSAMIHTGITSGCQTCHEKGYLWAGVSLYPISPTLVTANASYRGFQTRPYATATTYSVADAGHEATGMGVGTDCALCHSGTTAFTGAGKPNGHMPTTVSSCAVCHTGSDYSVAGITSLAALHTGITSGALVPATAANMLAKTCGKCHTVGTGGTSGTAPFAGCATQASCSTPVPITYQPATTGLHPVHVPLAPPTGGAAVDCNACHTSVTSFAGVNMKNASMHTSVYNTAKVPCMSCHERGLSFYGVTKLRVRPSGHHTGQDCGNSGCHTYTGGFRAVQRPIMRDAVVAPNMSRIRPTPQTGKISRGTLGNNYDHAGVKPGQCKECHNGQAASGMPARHLMVSSSCDVCHRSTTWTPAHFNHNGVTPNNCQACHNAMSASGRPAGHFLTTRSCDTCHKNMAWKPVMYQHLSPNYKPSPDALTCVSCHQTNGELVPRQSRGLTRPKPLPVGP